MYPKLTGCDDVDWIHLAQNRTKLLRALGQFLTMTATVRFLTRTPVDGDILLAETAADWTGTTRIFNPAEQNHTRMVKAIYSWYSISSRPTGRPKTRWMDDIRKDIRKLKVPNWKTLTQDRKGWKEKLVVKAKTL